MKKRTAVRFALLFALPAVLLTGCGGGGENVEKGMQAIEELDYQGALEQFDVAQEASENARLIARGKGIAYMGLTDYPQAIQCFQEALRGSNGFVQPVDYDLNYYLAAAYTKNGQYSEAEEVYNAILALKPEEEDAYFLRGNVRLDLSRYTEAKADFDLVASMDAGNYDRLIDIYESLSYYGYREAGEEYLNSALTAGNGKMDAFDSGRIYYYLGNYQQAAVDLEKAREKGGAESYLYLGKAYEAMGDYNYASSVYNSYLAKDASNAEVYNQLGLCELEKGEYQRALEAFQAGMRIEGNGMMQTLSFNEVVAYEYLGEYQQAAVLLNAYLEAYPDDGAAKREQQFLESR